ncbi:hypothetical protein STBA_71440 [Streptomyces sp. MP131-18]|nr:hypothetical protein STBA_71440 [Streptomyces sp. MP131-18]
MTDILPSAQPTPAPRPDHVLDAVTAQLTPTVVCLCGSTRFWTEMAEANLRETAASRIVLAPGCNLKEPHELWATPTQATQLKPLLDALHRRKIDMADEILVVNPGGYIGASTRSEIAYADFLGKRVRYTTEEHQGVTATRQITCHVAVCSVCGYTYDEGGDFGTYHYNTSDEAIAGATGEDPQYAFTQLPDGALLCRRSDRAHQEVLGALLAAATETHMHEQLAATGQQPVLTEETRHAALLTRPGHPSLRIGPYDTEVEADRIATGLREQLHHTTHVPGTVITTVVFDAELPHSEAYITTNPYELASRMDADEADAGKETAFPDTYARLHAQLGYERARDTWLGAAAAYDWMHHDHA